MFALVVLVVNALVVLVVNACSQSIALMLPSPISGFVLMQHLSLCADFQTRICFDARPSFASAEFAAENVGYISVSRRS